MSLSTYVDTSLSPLTTQAISIAYDKLPWVEKTQIDFLADALIKAAKDKNQRIQMSHSMAVEALGKIGIAMNGGIPT